ncbi:MAG: Fe-S cluster assembly ATPase SufC [Candidatus Babeliales bacterium]
MKSLLVIENLHTTIDHKNILNGINLIINEGSTHVLMGPNGSGKSSLTHVIMGHPRHVITQGSMIFQDVPINTLSPDKRAKLGIFLAFQHPSEIEGIRLGDFLREAYNGIYDKTPHQLSLKEFAAHLKSKLNLLKMSESFVERFINVGFSGGEKKLAEMLQLAVLQPKLAILDEIDSGLDIDALKTVCDTINTLRTTYPKMSFLIITHYPRILKHLQLDAVHVLRKGVIVTSGGPEIVEHLEQKGYK